MKDLKDYSIQHPNHSPNSNPLNPPTLIHMGKIRVYLFLVTRMHRQPTLSVNQNEVWEPWCGSVYLAMELYVHFYSGILVCLSLHSISSQRYIVAGALQMGQNTFFWTLLWMQNSWLCFQSIVNKLLFTPLAIPAILTCPNTDMGK